MGADRFTSLPDARLQADLSVRGRIFDVQKFSIHDGPGIRTIVFLKGCLLRCRWCCNPESQRYEPETMVKNGEETTVGYDVTVGELLPKILQDLPYYRRSGGGLTLSGGECLCQPDFTEALLRAAKAYGIHTAIETTAVVEYAVLERMLPYLDLILMDLKHTDTHKHLAFTGQPNERILANAQRLAEAHAAGNGPELIVRVPTIPTFNETDGEILAIARFAASLPGVHELHLLPYHRLGYDKYVGLGREYAMGEIPSPSQARMETLRTLAASTGLNVTVGG